MKVLVKNNDDAIFVCGGLQRMINRIKDSNLNDEEKTSFAIALSTIRDCVEIERGAECINLKKLDGVALIEKERLRQIEKKGYTKERDLAGNSNEQLARGAACYALPMEIRSSFFNLGMAHLFWPWAAKRFKPTPKARIRELEKAGALAAAKIDRLLTIAESEVKKAIEGG
jgi:hypothetical protein